MAYILNEEQEALRVMVHSFAEEEVRPISAEYDRSGELPIETYKKAFEMGLHVMEVPEEYGGGGVDYITAAACYEELGWGDAGFATGVCANGLAWKAVHFSGTPEQKQKFADVLTKGSGWAAFCLTESDAGSDAGATRTTAVREGDEYVLNGSKCFITNGGVADIYVVFATVDRSLGLKGVTAFMVERDRAGISIGKEEDKMGIRLSNTVTVNFDNVRIPAENMLGKEGKGFVIAMKTLDLARPLAGSVAVGVARRAMEEAVNYAKVRCTFGKPIAKLQALQFKMADMDIQIEAARQTISHCLQLVQAGKPYSREAAIAKCLAGDVAVNVALDAIQILGGYGYSREYPVEKLLRDAKIFQIFEGTNEIQRVVIAGNLLK